MKPREPGYQKERGERQMNRVLELLASGPMNSYQLSEAMHLSRQNVMVAVRRLMKRPNRRVYLHTFELRPGRPRHVFALGSKNDMTIERYQCGRIAERMGHETSPWSVYQLAEMMPMEYSTAKIYMRAMLRDQKVHIAAWGWSDRTPYPRYLMGKGLDVPRPKEMPKPARSVRPSASIFAALGIGL